VGPDGEVAQRQFVGILSSADPVLGIGFSLDGGGSYQLPPDGSALEEARPGSYRLRSTGETVVDPDYTCSWTVYRNASGTDVPATGSEILPPGHGRGCSLGCIRHHAVPSRDDQSSALVQLESIRTVATRAANAVGLYGPPGSKIPRSSAGFPCCRALGRTGRRVSRLRLLATSLAILLSANAFP